jgi:hypothetical protein
LVLDGAAVAVELLLAALLVLLAALGAVVVLADDDDDEVEVIMREVELKKELDELEVTERAPETVEATVPSASSPLPHGIASPFA